MNFVFDPSLVLYLPLFELDGSSFMSRDACGHAGTVTGALWQPDGRRFDGVDDVITVPDSTALKPTDAITVEIWQKKTGSGNDKGIITKGTGNGDYSLVWYAPEQIDVYIGGSKRVSSSGVTFTVGIFEHLAFTYDKGAGKVTVYKNGGPCGTASYAAAIATSATPLLLGRYYSATYSYPGTIGEVRVYNRALWPQEMQHNYLATKWRYQ